MNAAGRTIGWPVAAVEQAVMQQPASAAAEQTATIAESLRELGISILRSRRSDETGA